MSCCFLIICNIAFSSFVSPFEVYIPDFLFLLSHPEIFKLSDFVSGESWNGKPHHKWWWRIEMLFSPRFSVVWWMRYGTRMKNKQFKIALNTPTFPGIFPSFLFGEFSPSGKTWTHASSKWMGRRIKVLCFHHKYTQWGGGCNKSFSVVHFARELKYYSNIIILPTFSLLCRRRHI